MENEKTTVYRKKLIFDLLSKKVKNKKIIDVGCGDGQISLQFQNDAESITLNSTCSQDEKAIMNFILPCFKNKISYMPGSFINLNLPDKFDILLCLGVLLYVKNINDFVLKISETIITGGFCVLQFTSANNLFAKFNKKIFSPETFLYDNHEFIKLLEKNNLEIHEIVYFNFDFPFIKKLPEKQYLHFQKFMKKHFRQLALDRLVIAQKI